MSTTQSTERDAVVEVVNRYTYALDDRDWQLLDQVFAADAVGHYDSPRSAPLRGREAIVTSVRSFLDSCGPTQHLLGNHIVTIDGDTATSRCKARVHHCGAGERAALAPYECFGVYRDVLRRTADGWRITERTFDVQHAIGDVSVLRPVRATVGRDACERR